MNMLEWTNKRFLIRLLIITLLVFVYTLWLASFGIFSKLRFDFTHFAYVPIILSGIWWDRKAIIPAVALALLTMWFSHGQNTGIYPYNPILIAFFFIFIALFIGHLSSKSRSQTRALIDCQTEYLPAKLEANPEKQNLPAITKLPDEPLVHSARLAELDEMAAAMAHELNQPLTGIKNYAKNALYMLDEGAGTNDDVRDNLLQISKQVDRSTRIINQLRELARNSEHHFTLLNINDILKESLEFLGPHLTISGINSNVALGDNLPLIMGDKVRLEQVFINIITNARQAMEGVEERRLLVTSYLDKNDPLPLIIRVKDTGRGFKQADAEKLFAPFYTTKNPGQGTGLGLSISLSIIKDHQGHIEASGEAGKGACFTIKLPVAPSSNY